MTTEELNAIKERVNKAKHALARTPAYTDIQLLLDEVKRQREESRKQDTQLRYLRAQLDLHKTELSTAHSSLRAKDEALLETLDGLIKLRAALSDAGKENKV